MANTLKRLLSLAIALMLVISLMPVSGLQVYAAEAEPVSEQTEPQTQPEQSAQTEPQEQQEILAETEHKKLNAAAVPKTEGPVGFTGVLSETETGNIVDSWCPACGKKVTWVPIPNCAITDSSSNEYKEAQMPAVFAGEDYHYYVPQNRDADGNIQGVENNTKNVAKDKANSYFFLYVYGAGNVCIHLNGSKLKTASNAHVAGGTLNVMGDGEWSGSYGGNGRGTTVHNHSTTAVINLYSGTFKSHGGYSGNAEGSGRVPVAYGSGKNSGAGAINIYDPVRIEGDYLARACKTNMHGGTVTGRVLVVGYNRDDSYRPTFVYYGGEVQGQLGKQRLTKITYINDGTSDAPDYKYVNIPEDGGYFFAQGGNLNIYGGTWTAKGTEQEPFLHHGGLIYAKYDEHATVDTTAKTAKGVRTVVNIQDAVINGGVVQGKNGGAIYIEGNQPTKVDEINRYDYAGINIKANTRISGGKAIPVTTLDGDTVNVEGGLGGNIYTKDAAVVVGIESSEKSTVISCGEAYQGGNIHFAKELGNNSLTINTSALVEYGKALDAVHDDTHKATASNGGNIFSRYSTAVYGELAYGEADNAGGNIHVNGASLNFKTKTTGGAYVHHGKADMGGNAYGTWKITSDAGTVISYGEANSGGNIYYPASGGCKDWDKGLRFSGSITNGKALNGSGGNIYSSNTGMNLHLLAGEVKDGQASVCGGNIYTAGGTVYVGNDSGEAVLVTGGETTYTGESANGGGNIFAQNVTVKATGMVSNGKSAHIAGNIRAVELVNIAGMVSNGEAMAYGGNICCKGGTITGTVQNGLAHTYGGNIAAAGGNLLIIDGGQILNGKAYTNGGNINSNNSGVWVKGDALIDGGIANYQPTDGSTNSSADGKGGNICMFGGDTSVEGADGLVLESGTVSNGEVQGANSVGGNIFVYKNGDYPGDITLKGSVISNGYSKTAGGNIYIASNIKMTMLGGSVSGGNADSSGGNIYVAKSAKLEVTGGKIANGNAATFGGNVCLAESAAEVSFANCTFTEGVAERGGSIFLTDNTCEVLFDNCEITGGSTSEADANAATVANGGNIYVGKNNTVTITDCEITGGIARNASTAGYYGGGNLFLAGGATATLTDTTVSGGQAIAGGNILTQSKSVLNLGDGTTVSGGKASGEAIPCGGGNIQTSGGTVNIYAGAVVSGGTAKYGTNVGAIYGGTINVNGGTIGTIEEKDAATVLLHSSSSNSESKLIVNDGTVYGLPSLGTAPRNIYIYHGQFSVNPEDYIASDAQAGTYVYENNGLYEVHVKGAAGETVNKTCTTDGYTPYTCGYSKAVSEDLTLSCTDSFCADVVSAGHEPEAQEGKEATHTEDGYKAYWYCNDCKIYFEDEACTKVIENLETWKAGDGKIAAEGHTWGEEIAAKTATCTQNGNIAYYDCAKCELYAVKNGEEYVITAWDAIETEDPNNHKYTVTYANNGETHIEIKTCENNAEHKVETPNQAHVYDQKDNTECVCGAEKPQAEETHDVLVNGERVESLQAALEAAGEGDTVVLLRDVELDGKVVVVNQGVTLDLNGNVLTLAKGAYLLANFNGSCIQDNSEGNTGRLYISADKLRVLNNNEQLPVQTETGIMFVDVDIDGRWSESSDCFKFWLADSTDVAFIQQMGIDYANSGLKVVVELEWNGGANTMVYEYQVDTLGKYLEMWDTGCLTLKVSGAEGIDDLRYTAKVVFAQDTEAEVVKAGSAVTQGAQQ